MSAHRSVVVGVDGSKASLQAVAWAAREADRRRLSLALVTTVSVRNTFGVPIGMPAGFFEQEESEGREILLDAAEYARRAVPDRELDIETHLCTGSPSLELVDRSKSASMVVVGAGYNRFGWERFGSVGTALVTHTHAPAVVVRDLPHVEINDISGPVVVGVDGSEHSSRAIAAAFEEAALRGTELVAVHAWSDLDVRAPFRFRIDWDSVENRERALLSENLSGHGEQFPDVTVRPVVVLDQPSRYLASHAADAQLLVLGRRGRGGFPNLLLGSTTWALLHTVTCPVMVVP
ncbi:universal stress protein [Rhodococcus gordoniae]|uniref:Universal stress protein n=1 Tax=Rhodococcus gordoniae TaxID=223392 RepID=A0A379LY82_9NOCA|nr:universal stress protein [Rhodococcus gordoniae]SUE14288.1 universal stress protein [Rhodococcus gordoniae]